jgi:hypothetical protein
LIPLNADPPLSLGMRNLPFKDLQFTKSNKLFMPLLEPEIKNLFGYQCRFKSLIHAFSCALGNIEWRVLAPLLGPSSLRSRAITFFYPPSRP